MANFDEWDFAPASSGSAGQSDGFSTAPATPESPVKGGWHWQQTFVSLMVVAALSFLIAYLTRTVNNRNTLLIGLSFMVPMAAMLFSALMVENASNAMTPYYSRKAQAIVALLGTLATFTVGCLCDAIYLGNLTPVYETVSVTSNECNFVFAMDKSGSMSGNRDRESIQAINDILDSLPDDVSVGLVLFSSDVLKNGTVPMARLTAAQRSQLKSTLTMDPTGLTNFDQPLQTALNLYDQNPPTNGYPTRIVMVSDGVGDLSTAEDIINRCKADSLSISCIQLESSLDPALQHVIDATGGSGHSIHDYGDLITTLQEVTQLVTHRQYEIDQDLLRSRSSRAIIITLIMMLLEGLSIGMALWLMLSVKGQFRFQVILSPLMSLASFALLKFAPLSLFDGQQWLLEGAAFTLLGVVFMRRNRVYGQKAVPNTASTAPGQQADPFDF